MSVRGLIHYGTEYCKMVIPRLWPTRSWHYSGGKRDLRLDLLRGFAVIAMVADHIGGERSWLYAITGGDAFFVSAAEVFVFISGLLMGMIYAGVIALDADLYGAISMVGSRMGCSDDRHHLV